MSTWLNIADWVLCMARCRSFWEERRGLTNSGRLRVKYSSKYQLLSCWPQQCPRRRRSSQNLALEKGCAFLRAGLGSAAGRDSSSGYVGMAGISRPAEIPYPGDSRGPSLSIHSQQSQRGSDAEGLLLRSTDQHHQLAKPHLPPTPARLHALSTKNLPKSRRQARAPLPATPPLASPGQRDPGRKGGMRPVTHNHVLQGVLGKPAVQKHRNEQIPQRRPEYL